MSSREDPHAQLRRLVETADFELSATGEKTLDANLALRLAQRGWEIVERGVEELSQIDGVSHDVLDDERRRTYETLADVITNLARLLPDADHGMPCWEWLEARGACPISSPRTSRSQGRVDIRSPVLAAG